MSKAYVKLTQGKRAIVDTEDKARVEQISWQYLREYRRPKFGRAVHQFRDGQIKHHLNMSNFILGVDGIVDHKNGNALDNRKENLRPCTTNQNNKNKPSHKRRVHKQLQKYKGVYYRPLDRGYKRKSPYFVMCASDKKRYGGGYHRTPEEAALAYNALALKLHGEFARLNTIKQKKSVLKNNGHID